ncbi:hypothetical protein D0T11_02565 [Hymenobacter rubripertinctus]|uniref:Uncharacterized protein n=1 Tax=Hymenobacter rubripertinctus TaxID=2029981 RepID=A0A418R7G5_9BACT|nr:hypothetical protein D0T11_02565 [Hymenobacter rubripertinctus]
MINKSLLWKSGTFADVQGRQSQAEQELSGPGRNGRHRRIFDREGRKFGSLGVEKLESDGRGGNVMQSAAKYLAVGRYVPGQQLYARCFAALCMTLIFALTA